MMFSITILLATLSLKLSPISAILLDIHVPLPHGCLLTQALRANLLLQEIGRPPVNKNEQSTPQDSREGIDLFTKHIPHITLYMADFDLEQSENGTTTKLNQTKVDSFIKTIDSLNYTSVNTSSCPLSFAAQTPATSPSSNSYFSINNDKYFVINGAYTMLPIKNNACLQHLSDRLLDPLGPFLKMPPVVPSWVHDLPQEEKEEKIAQVEQYGSPNVLNNFEPHVTVGYDVFRRRLQDCASGECRDLQGQCQPIVECFADPCTETPGVKCGDGEVCTPNLCGGCIFQCEALLQSSNQGQSQLRVDTMDQWNESFQTISGQCNGEVMGVAVGRTGVGGTVLSDSRMGYWELFDDDDDDQMVIDEKKDVYARVEE